MPLRTFHPADLPRLIEDLATPTLSLAQVAERHHTSLDSLCLNLTTSEALLHLANTELAAALRIRLAAQFQLHHAVLALTHTLKSFNEEAGTQATQTEATPDTVSAAKPTVFREQQRSNARRAAHLLFRLATFAPRPLAGIAPPAPHPFPQPELAREPGPARSSSPVAPKSPEPAPPPTSHPPAPQCAATHAAPAVTAHPLRLNPDHSRSPSLSTSARTSPAAAEHPGSLPPLFSSSPLQNLLSLAGRAPSRAP